MTLSNLPPGVSDSDIPGNSNEDAAWEALHEQIDFSGLTAPEAKRRWDSQPDLLETLRGALDTIIWMSGSDDFSPGGKAHEGWVNARPKVEACFLSISKAAVS